MKTKCNKSNESKKSIDHRYISYFQSVLTIGVMSRAKNSKEAEKMAMLKLKDKNGVNYCVFDQTPFEITRSEKWTPEFESDSTPEGLAFRFNPDNKTKNIIATRLNKDIQDLTDADIEDFIKQSIDHALINN